MNQFSMNAPESLPHSVEAEQQLLGALLNDNNLAHKIGGVIDAKHFYEPVHARMFENIMGRIRADKLASAVTVMADMANDDGLKELGHGRYLANIAGGAVASFAIVDYGQTIAELHRRRVLLALCDDVRGRIANDEPASTSIAEMEMFLHKQEPDGEPRTMSLLKAHTLLIQNQIDVRDGKNPSIPSGLADLDDVLNLSRGRYTILGGTTSMGKSAMALYLTYQAAKAGYGVGFVSREMNEPDLAARMNSIDSKIPYKAFERAMSDNSFNRMIEAAKLQESFPVQIFSARVDDIPAIMSEAKNLQHMWPPNGQFKGLGLLVVDYIQLIKGKGNNFEVLSSVANELKQVAKLLNVHVLALAQIDRKLIEAENPRPQLSHLRGSGDLENAPDNVMFCFREEWFLERKPKPKSVEDLADFVADLEASRGKMELIIAKARMGETCTVKVGCDMATNRFWTLDSTKDMEF